jgi:hypothetical protein
MRKQIEQIINKVESGDLAYHDAVDELLLLYNVSGSILSKLHQPNVIESVCYTCRFNKSITYHDKMWCRDCQQKNHYEQTEH